MTYYWNKFITGLSWCVLMVLPYGILCLIDKVFRYFESED